MTALEHLQEAAEAAIIAGMPMHEFKALAGAVLTDKALARFDENQCRAARFLQVHRNTIGRLKTNAWGK